MGHSPLRGRARLVSIIVVAWNSATHLRRCLEGIQLQMYPECELIVVDNASTDESAAIASRSSAGLIRNERNRGFSAAVNQALAIAGGEFIALVNPDCFLDSAYIERMLAGFDKAGEAFGMGTGKLIQAEGSAIAPTSRIDSLGIRMTRTGRHFDIGNGEPDGAPVRGILPLSPTEGLFEVFGPSGAAAVYRRSFLNDVALRGEVFDEDFFAYREDADLAWRGRLFGWRGLYVAGAIAHHVRRVTPSRRRELPSDINMHSLKNRFLLRIKNEGLYLALRNGPFEIARDLVTIGAALTVERTSLPAFAWLWRNRRNLAGKRREIQRRRKVGDRALARWFR